MYAVKPDLSSQTFWILLTLLISLSRLLARHMKRVTHWILCCLMAYVYASVKFVTLVYRIISLFYLLLQSLVLGLQLVLLHATCHPLTTSQFSIAFKNSMLYTLDGCCDLSAEELITLFDSICTDILDFVAPFRTKRSKLLSDPWLNDTSRALRRACTRAERKWKKDKLHVSLGILWDCLSKYLRAVKTAKTEFISNLVSQNSHRPQVLFTAFNSLINPCDTARILPSPTFCENFLKLFYR